MVGYDLLVLVHAACGLGGLCVLGAPLLAKKGGRLHRWVGWAFVAAMVGTAVTGLVISGLWLVAPLAVKPAADGASAADLARRVASLRELGGFLGYLAMLILSAVWHGIRSVRLRRGGGATGHLDLAVAVVILVGGVALLATGLALGSPLLVVFGAIGAFGGWTDLRAVRRPLPSRMAWWYRHMGQMCGAGIAAVTAFLVFNVRHFVTLPDGLAMVPWLAPTLVGSPLVALWVGRYRVRFGETG